MMINNINQKHSVHKYKNFSVYRCTMDVTEFLQPDKFWDTLRSSNDNIGSRKWAFFEQCRSENALDMSGSWRTLWASMRWVINQQST